MKCIKDFINESLNESINDGIAKIEEISRKLYNNKELHFNVSDKMITFVGEKNEDQTDFENKILKLLEKGKINLKGFNLGIFRKINKDKCPVFYIADKDYLESIKKDLAN